MRSIWTRCSGGKTGRPPAAFGVRDGVNSPLLVPLPQRPEACAAPPEPMDNRVDALAPIQCQEGLGTTRHPLAQVAISEQGLSQASIILTSAIGQWLSSPHPPPSLPYQARRSRVRSEVNLCQNFGYNPLGSRHGVLRIWWHRTTKQSVPDSAHIDRLHECIFVLDIGFCLPSVINVMYRSI